MLKIKINQGGLRFKGNRYEFILCWGGNYCFLERNPKTILPPNHVTDERTEPRGYKNNIVHAKTLRSSPWSLFQWDCEDVMLQP